MSKCETTFVAFFPLRVTKSCQTPLLENDVLEICKRVPWVISMSKTNNFIKIIKQMKSVFTIDQNNIAMKTSSLDSFVCFI